MKPLPIRAAQDLMRMLNQPVYRDQRLKLWLSYFEIYGGKLYDLLSERKLVFLLLFLYLLKAIFGVMQSFFFAFDKMKIPWSGTIELIVFICMLLDLLLTLLSLLYTYLHCFQSPCFSLLFACITNARVILADLFSCF